MTDKQFTIADMIGAVNDESPSGFQAAFNSLVLDKIQDAISAKKAEIASNYFNYEDETEEEEDTEEETSDAESNEGTDDEDTETVAGKEDGQS
jgi:hypothetical protein